MSGVAFLNRCVSLTKTHTHTHTGGLRLCEWLRGFLGSEKRPKPSCQKIRLVLEMLEDRNAPNGLGGSPPFAADDWFDLLHDTVLTGNLLSNDYDPDGDPLSVRRFIFNGTDYTPGQQIAITQGDQTAGYLTVHADGTFQFVPSLRYKGPISFSYTIFDGEYESTAWVTINVYNNPPQASDSSFDVLHDSDLSGDLLSLGWDLDGDPLSIVAINGTAIGDNGPYYFGQPISLPSGATLTVFADGTFNYSPPPNYTGSDSFTFTLSDSLDSTSATINIFLYNNAPVATDASYRILHDTTLTGQVYGYDPDGDAITAHLVTGPEHGTVTLHADGAFTYTPNPHFVGTDTFTYRMDDGVTSSGGYTIRIEVYNTLPILTPGLMLEYTYDWDVGCTVIPPNDLLALVHDPDNDPVTPVISMEPSFGTVNVAEDGSITYRLKDPAQFVGTWPEVTYARHDSFSLKFADSAGSLSQYSIFVFILIVPDPQILKGCSSTTPSTPVEKANWHGRVDTAAANAGKTDRYWVVLVIEEPKPGTGQRVVIPGGGGSSPRQPNVGHAFVVIVDRNNPDATEGYGLYPASGIDPTDARLITGVRGRLGYDLTHTWTVAAAWPIEEAKFTSIKERFDYVKHNPPDWKAEFGCLDWALDVIAVNGGVAFNPEPEEVNGTTIEKKGSIADELAAETGRPREQIIQGLRSRLGERSIRVLYPGVVGKLIREQVPQGAIRIIP